MAGSHPAGSTRADGGHQPGLHHSQQTAIHRIEEDEIALNGGQIVVAGIVRVEGDEFDTQTVALSAHISRHRQQTAVVAAYSHIRAQGQGRLPGREQAKGVGHCVDSVGHCQKRANIRAGEPERHRFLLVVAGERANREAISRDRPGPGTGP